MNLQRELGLSMPANRYSDDDDVVESHLLRSLDRYGDRQYHKSQSGLLVPTTAVMRDRCLSAYEADLLILERRNRFDATY